MVSRLFHKSPLLLLFFTCELKEAAGAVKIASLAGGGAFIGSFSNSTLSFFPGATSVNAKIYRIIPI